MSTYFYLECLDHDPPLECEDEVGQHYYDLPNIRQMLANREHIVAIGGDVTPPGYYDRNGWRFLRAHPKCRIGITDEYGVKHPTTEDGEEK